MTAPVSSILTFSGVGLTWPDGDTVLDGLDLLVPPGRSGLVGVNGSGKSTLLRLAAGVLAPTRGSVQVTGEVGYLPQDLTLDRDRRVDDLLGIAEPLRALRRLDAGSGDPADLDAVGDDWDVEERATAELDRLGLPSDAPRPPGRRAVRRRGDPARPGAAAPAPARRAAPRRADQQPRRPARARLHDVLGSWPRTLLVVSHDRELLERMDRIGELRDGQVRWYGGGFSAYAEQVRAEQEAAEQAVAAARSDVRRQKADRVEAERVARPAHADRVERNAIRTNMGKAARDYYKNRSEKQRGERTARCTTSGSSRRAIASTRPRLGCARTGRSGSTCPPPRRTGAGSSSPRTTSCCAPALPSSSTCEGRTGSRSSAPTARARPRCSTRSPAPCRRGPGRSGRTCRWACCPSGSTCSTTS